MTRVYQNQTLHVNYRQTLFLYSTAMLTRQVIGKRIVEARKTRQLTQEMLGARLSRSKASISQWEKGDAEPDMLTLVALARELRVSLDWLLTDGDRPAAFLSANLADRIEQMSPEVRASLAALLSTEPQLKDIGGELPRAPYSVHEPAAEYNHKKG